MITVALLLASAPPLPTQAHSPRPADRAWRNASQPVPPRDARRLHDLHQAVQSLGASEPERAGPSGL